MYEVDQQYRDSLSRCSSDKPKQKYFGHLIVINDPVNRTILLKILKKYGWPCDNDSRKLSTKAWHIAWHTRSNFELLSEFYSYIIQADKPSCIDSVQLSAIEEQIATVKKARSK
ncbi:hypothetical protein [Spirosoma flavum]|uniref:Uncharacterized protein n=1 Tax=Spirosoma flavum TaxID=2048557 RepID=A0ABW6AW95_9BACT